MNRAKVLRLICERPHLTRQMIVQRTHLSKMSVTNIIGEYAARGLLAECACVPSDTAGAGRPACTIVTKPDALLVMGIYLSEMEITCSLINFHCEVVAARSCVPTTTETNDELLAKIDELLCGALEDGGVRAGDLFGIGIASVGLIDYGRGRMLRADNFPRIADLPLVDYYKRRFSLPVMLANDMDASAIAEKYFGCGVGVSDFIYVGVNSCIGVGLYIGDRIYRGHNGLAGELGYTTIDYQGPRFPCGNRGRLEAYVRIDKFVHQANCDLAAGAPGLPPFAKHHMVTWPDIISEARKGSPYCLSAIHEIGDYLSVALVNLINLFDPEMIVLGGQIAAAGDLIVDYVAQSVRGRSVKRLLAGLDSAEKYQETRIALAHFGNRSAAIGAGAILYDALFQGELSAL
ncbi:MAG: ROK family transcriptional regulator [Clostridia bacterium]